MTLFDSIALFALILGLTGWLRAARLQKRVMEAQKEMESLRSHVTASTNILERKIEDLRVSAQPRAPISSQTGRFHQDMTVAEVLALHPDAGDVMAQFHLGGCSSCSISEHHVLGPACESYGVDVNRLLGALNGLLDGGSVPAKQSRSENLIQIDSNL